MEEEQQIQCKNLCGTMLPKAVFYSSQNKGFCSKMCEINFNHDNALFNHHLTDSDKMDPRFQNEHPISWDNYWEEKRERSPKWDDLREI